MVMSNDDNAGSDKTYSHLIKTTTGPLTPMCSTLPSAHSSSITANAAPTIAAHGRYATRLHRSPTQTTRRTRPSRRLGLVRLVV